MLIFLSDFMIFCNLHICISFQLLKAA